MAYQFTFTKRFQKHFKNLNYVAESQSKTVLFEIKYL